MVVVVSGACVQNLVDWMERLFKAAGNRDKEISLCFQETLVPRDGYLESKIAPLPSPMPPELAVHPQSHQSPRKQP